MTTEKMTAGGICRKLSEAQSILILTQNDLGQEIENGNDHIGLGVYRRALDSVLDLIGPCYDSLSEYQETAPMPNTAPKPAIAGYVEALDEKAWTVQHRLYSLEANLSCIQQALHHPSKSIDPTEALGTAIAEAATLSDMQEKVVDGIKKLAD